MGLQLLNSSAIVKNLMKIIFTMSFIHNNNITEFYKEIIAHFIQRPIGNVCTLRLIAGAQLAKWDFISKRHPKEKKSHGNNTGK